MFTKFKDMDSIHKTGLGGTGKGYGDLTVLTPHMPDNMKAFTQLRLEPGTDIGVHAHTGDSEIYLCLEGNPILIDDGKEIPMEPWDCHICLNGHTHGMRNETDSTVVILACIAYEKN